MKPIHSRGGDIAADITNRILAELKAGVLPWRKPWDGARVAPVLPRRVTGETYRGLNVIILWSATVEAGYGSPYWLTFKQANKLGAHVRKGEHGQAVVYYGQAARKQRDAGGAETEDKYRFLKSYVVFSADQIEGLPEHFYPARAPLEVMPVAAHEAWFAQLEIGRIAMRDIACYIPSKDVIGMPPIAAFDTAADYAATLNHECVHATMAKHRVGRDLGTRYGGSAFAAEEMVAEIGASFLGVHLSLPPHHIHNHAAYIGQWIKLLADDKRALLSAAAQAQVAVDWLLAKSPVAAIEEHADVAA